jgi:hypothetical protein
MTFDGSLISSTQFTLNCNQCQSTEPAVRHRCTQMCLDAMHCRIDRSAVGDATESVSAKWKQEIISGDAAEKEDSLL